MKSSSQPSSTVSAVSKIEDNLNDTVVVVFPSDDRKIYTNNSIVCVSTVNGKNFPCFVLLGTGSPVSFLCSQSFSEIFDSPNLLVSSEKSFKVINGKSIQIIGSIETTIKLDSLSDFQPKITFHILNGNSFTNKIVLGRDFLIDNKISCIFNLSEKEENNRLKLFSEIASADVIDNNYIIDNVLEDLLLDAKIDFDTNVKRELIITILEVENANIIQVEDDYSVKIKLKDDFTYRYSPRRFAWSEKLEIRKIINDLLQKGIIKESSSEYCARIVSVKKKNGSLRLCADLWPLNERVLKQKYPFLIIEDCLSRISDKKIFTLLDLKDGFYNIKIHPDYTKFFAFATPDGQARIQ